MSLLLLYWFFRRVRTLEPTGASVQVVLGQVEVTPRSSLPCAGWVAGRYSGSGANCRMVLTSSGSG
jgi:hypothetical protein